MESTWRNHAKHEKTMCKHCKSTAHSSLQHGKHYKEFQSEQKEKRMQKHMKMWDSEKGKEAGAGDNLKRKHMKSAPSADQPSTRGFDPNLGLGKAGYGRATAVPKSAPVKPQIAAPRFATAQPNANSTPMHAKHKKSVGTYKGKSLALGHGGRAARLHDELPSSMPESEKGAIIGKIARSKGAAPGQKNYHGKKA